MYCIEFSKTFYTINKKYFRNEKKKGSILALWKVVCTEKSKKKMEWLKFKTTDKFGIKRKKEADKKYLL